MLSLSRLGVAGLPRNLSCSAGSARLQSCLSIDNEWQVFLGRALEFVFCRTALKKVKVASCYLKAFFLSHQCKTTEGLLSKELCTCQSHSNRKAAKADGMDVNTKLSSPSAVKMLHLSPRPHALKRSCVFSWLFIYNPFIVHLETRLCVDLQLYTRALTVLM